MKMKLLTVLGFCLLALPNARAAEPTSLEELLAREAAVVPVQAEYDAAVASNTLTPALTQKLASIKYFAVDRYTPVLGDGWRARWQASKLADPDDELVAMYKVAPLNFRVPGWPGPHMIGRVSLAGRLELLDFIAAKPTLTTMDLDVISFINIYRPAIADRMADIAALLPSGGIRGEEYYAFRNKHVLVRPGAWLASMKVSEWIDLAMQPAHVSPSTFTAGRDKVMLKLARLMIEKRQAQGLPTEGAEFDAAFAPVVAALKAPKFAGLREIVSGLGLPIELPTELDWSAQEAVAAVVQDAAERNGTFLTSWGATVPYSEGLGSVMFVKGETAYEAWRQATIAND